MTKIPKKIKNIIFDLGGVVMDLDIEKTKRALARLGFDESMFHLHNNGGEENVFLLLERGFIPEEVFFSRLKTIVGKPVSTKQLISAWNAMILGFNPLKIKLLLELKPKFRTFLLSNTNVIHIKRCNEIISGKYNMNSLNDLFEKTYYSYETGLRKPEPDIFELVIRENNLIPSETLFIDDSKEHLETARLLGIKTLLLERNASLTLDP